MRNEPFFTWLSVLILLLVSYRCIGLKGQNQLLSCSKTLVYPLGYNIIMQQCIFSPKPIPCEQKSLQFNKHTKEMCFLTPFIQFFYEILVCNTNMSSIDIGLLLYSACTSVHWFRYGTSLSGSSHYLPINKQGQCNHSDKNNYGFHHAHLPEFIWKSFFIKSLFWIKFSTLPYLNVDSSLDKGYSIWGPEGGRNGKK